jgi:hypothetical protein
MRNTLEVMIGLLNHLQGKFDEASRFYESAANRDKRLNSYTAIPIAMARLANLKMVTGQLHAAAELCRENQSWVERHGTWRFYISGNLKIAQAAVLREWNRLKEAEQLVRNSRKPGLADPICSGVRLSCPCPGAPAQGDLAGALELSIKPSHCSILSIHFDILVCLTPGGRSGWLRTFCQRSLGRQCPGEV